MAVEMLSAVALINQTLEAKDMGAFCATLISPAVGLADIDDGLMQRFAITPRYRDLLHQWPNCKFCAFSLFQSLTLKRITNQMSPLTLGLDVFQMQNFSFTFVGD